VVPDNVVPSDVKQEFRWVSGKSVTDMEFEIGLFTQKNKETVSLVMVRDSIPDAAFANSVIDDGDSSIKLDNLKSRVRKSRLPLVDYNPKWSKVQVTLAATCIPARSIFESRILCPTSLA
jgi:hypothetical protein